MKTLVWILFLVLVVFVYVFLKHDQNGATLEIPEDSAQTTDNQSFEKSIEESFGERDPEKFYPDAPQQ